MGLDFTAVDVETANPAMESVCQLGAALVRDGQVVDQREWLIRPATGLTFTNTWIHGIRAEDVADAPEYPRVLLEFADWAGASSLVAYSQFDRRAVGAVHRMLGVPVLPWLWRDALVLARRRLELDHYRLPVVAEYLGVEFGRHHRAGDDAVGCARVVLEIARRAGCEDLDELWFGETPRRTSSGVYKRNPKANVEADPANPLFGQVVCFTGGLEQFTRGEAKALAAGLGARVVEVPSGKTTLVVQGEFDPASLRPGAKVGGKASKAMELAAKGQAIQIVDEVGFLDLVEGWV